jgi:hypothetical protein
MEASAVDWLVSEMKKLEIRVFENDLDKLLDLLKKAKEKETNNMCKFAEFVSSYPDKNKNKNGELLHAKSKYDGAERTIDLLDKYYEEKKYTDCEEEEEETRREP